MAVPERPHARTGTPVWMGSALSWLCRLLSGTASCRSPARRYEAPALRDFGSMPVSPFLMVAAGDEESSAA
jgi:hypothetical protein